MHQEHASTRSGAPKSSLNPRSGVCDPFRGLIRQQQELKPTSNLVALGDAVSLLSSENASFWPQKSLLYFAFDLPARMEQY